MSVSVTIKNLEKNFGRYPALKSVSLDIGDGELVALLGPSGSGKTTLLRAVAGLEIADAGHVFFGEIDANQLTLRERRIGFVFQHYALFKHMTVLDNIAFGLRARPRRTRPSEQTIRNKVMELLGLVQLDGLEGRYPAQLSGGQRQRVALARALAIEPRVLLLDEPFGALDAKVRKDLRKWLCELHRRTRHTTLFVTHDQDEAFELADRVAILNGGIIEQVGPASEILENPATPFIAEFVEGIARPETRPLARDGSVIRMSRAV
jgi:sulfate/thiosulfate transport system ATP-binding protein